MGTTRLSAQGTVGRGLSPAIWQAYGFIGGNLGDKSLKPFFFDDFANLGVMASTVSQGGYVTLQEGGSLVQQAAEADNSEGEFGVLMIDTNDADQEQTHIELGSGKAGLVRLDIASGERAVVCWEARIKRTTVLDNQLSFAFGIGEPGIAVDGALVNDDAGIKASGLHFVGFETLAASNEEIDAIYGHNAVATEVQVTDNAGTAVADTWMKLGCVFDPLAPTDEKMKYFIDGAEIAYDTAVTDTIITAGTAFPTTDELTLCLLTINGATTTEYNLYMDWWAVGSYAVDV